MDGTERTTVGTGDTLSIKEVDSSVPSLTREPQLPTLASKQRLKDFLRGAIR